MFCSVVVVFPNGTQQGNIIFCPNVIFCPTVISVLMGHSRVT